MDVTLEQIDSDIVNALHSIGAPIPERAPTGHIAGIMASSLLFAPAANEFEVAAAFTAGFVLATRLCRRILGNGGIGPSADAIRVDIGSAKTQLEQIDAWTSCHEGSVLARFIPLLEEIKAKGWIRIARIREIYGPMSKATWKRVKRRLSEAGCKLELNWENRTYYLPDALLSRRRVKFAEAAAAAGN